MPRSWQLFLQWLSVAAECFSEGDPPTERKLLLAADGSTLPVGVWVNGWEAGEATAKIVKVLAEEKLGYEVELKGPGPSTPDAFFALSGCRAPTNITDRQCGSEKTYVHINVEGWTGGFMNVWEEVQARYPRTAPRNLGSMGYTGYAQAFLRSDLQEAAYRAEGLSLDFYRDYNVSWKDPAKYFASPLVIDRSRLRRCDETNLMDSREMAVYAEITADFDGVSGEGDAVHGKCWMDYFWLAPSCRHNISKCLVHFTGGTGWSMSEQMQKAAVLNMPLAIAVASNWSNYASLPKDYASIFYWWAPDPTFLRLNPTIIAFPPYDREAWERGDRRTSPLALPIEKHVSQDLSVLAPDLEELMKAFTIDIKAVNAIMLDKGESGDSYDTAVCRWLKSNEEKWKRWLPDRTRCFAGFGLFDGNSGSFVQSRAQPEGLSCKACQAGQYSQQVQDDQGFTFICKPCGVGTYQDFAAALSCKPCPSGRYQDIMGSRQCERCGIGTYQDAEGGENCTSCPASTTTVGLGSDSTSDCACMEGSIDVADEGTECVVCPEGIWCPFSSSVTALVQGNSSLGADYVPELEKGYMSDTMDPLNVHKCVHGTCLGGQPGCSRGRHGATCSSCPLGLSWNGGACEICSPQIAVLWLLAFAVVGAGAVVAYYLMNGMQSQAGTPLESSVAGFSLIAFVLQTTSVLGLMTVRWSPSVENTFSFLTVFRLDMDTWRIGCIAGQDDLARYIFTAAIFPCFTCWLLACWLLSKGVPKRWQWAFYKTLNTIGSGLQVGFVSMAAVAMKPFMCYRHPNGLRSLTSFPDTFCGQSDHAVMMVVAFALMAFMLVFLSGCIIAALQLPTWSLQHRTERVQTFRFFSGKFRLATWYWGLPLLLRSLGFTVALALLMDVPSLQRTAVSILFALYLGAQAHTWPWKVYTVNVADVVVGIGVLLLLGQPQEIPSGQDVSDSVSMGILAVLFGSVALLACLSLVALVHQALGGNPQSILNLGKSWQSSKIAGELRECAKNLLQLEADYLAKTLQPLNNHDLTAIAHVITIVSAEVLLSETGLSRRVRANSLGSRPSFATRDQEEESDEGQANKAEPEQFHTTGAVENKVDQVAASPAEPPEFVTRYIFQTEL